MKFFSFFLLFSLAAAEAEPPMLELMPEVNDHTSMWWRDGFPTVVEGADWRRVVKTGHYWFMLDTDTLKIPRIGPVTTPVGELPGADLELSIEVGGKTYHYSGGGAWSRFGGPRLIESGRFLQRADVTDLAFTAEDGTKLNTEARFETAAWADRLGLIFAARPGQMPIAEGENSFGRVRGGFGLTGANRFDVPADEASTPEKFTLSFWVYPPNDFRAGKHAPWLVCKNHHEQADGNYGIILHPDGIPDIRINLGGGRENSHNFMAERRHALRLEQWNHVAISYDGDILRLYVNGHFAVEEQLAKARIPRSGGLTFGDRQDGLDGFRFRGVIDEVTLFNQALQLSQLRHLQHHPEKRLPHLQAIRSWSFSDTSEAALTNPRESWKNASLTLRLDKQSTISDISDEEGWVQAALMIDPTSLESIPGASEVAIEATEFATNVSRAVTYDPAVGWYRINLDGIEPIPPEGEENPTNDAIERIQLRLTNPTKQKQVARLMFEKTAHGITQKIGAPITGINAILRDKEGYPTGIPVQLSKNWHSHSRGGVYNGQWFHGITQVRLPAAADEVELELAIVYGHWGGLPAASHSQLSLIGWGTNQRWDQSALGAWGESICFSPDQIQASCAITDVRPLMVTSMNQATPRFNWTNNVGGGDFFRLFDEAGQRIHHGPTHTIYHRQGPCLTEVTYAGRIGDAIRRKKTVSLSRGDHIVRGAYRIRIDVDEPVDFSRFVIFQIGADSYNPTREGAMAIGNESGLLREWKTLWGGDIYRTEPMEMNGQIPWASLHEAGPQSKGKTGAWANRGIVIREWSARLGGRDSRPWIAERGLNLGPEETSTLDILTPPSMKRLEKGDFVEATIEHLVVPQSAKDYYGPDNQLRIALENNGNTSRMIQREAVGNHRNVEVQTGKLIRSFPDIRIETVEDRADFQISGGIGFLPFTFSGLQSHSNYLLLIDGVKFDQTVHGLDFWQTDYDPQTQSWSQTYNLRPSSENQSYNIQFLPES